jgi:hypothetical protein
MRRRLLRGGALGVVDVSATSAGRAEEQLKPAATSSFRSRLPGGDQERIPIDRRSAWSGSGATAAATTVTVELGAIRC